MPSTESADGDLLVRAIRVLEGLAGMEQPASLPAVIDRVGLPRTQVYRALRALQDAGYVDHAGRRGYRVAARGVSLGSLLTSRPELRELARPVLTRLATTTSAIASFHLRSGHDRVLILAAAPPRRDRTGTAPSTPLGERAPLSRGCAGRAILAHLPVADVGRVLGEDDEAGSDAVRADLARVARDGVAVSFGDNHHGHHGISAPVLDPEAAVPLGSITLSGDARHFDETALRGMRDALRAAADRMAPHLAAILGAGASSRRQSLDVGPGRGGSGTAP